MDDRVGTAHAEHLTTKTVSTGNQAFGNWRNGTGCRTMRYRVGGETRGAHAFGTGECADRLLIEQVKFSANLP
jgi:hypothetical protein